MTSPKTGMDQETFVSPPPAPKDTETLDIFASAPEAIVESAQTGGKVIDLMEALKASLAKTKADADSASQDDGSASRNEMGGTR